MKKSAMKQIVFILYILVVLRLTVLRDTSLSGREINLMPFVDLIKVYKTSSTWQFLRLFLGNIVWFVPWGFLIPVIMKKSNAKFAILSGFAFSLSIEVLQFVFKKGYFELDDLILNTIGAAIGYILYRLVRHFMSLQCR